MQHRIRHPIMRGQVRAQRLRATAMHAQARHLAQLRSGMVQAAFDQAQRGTFTAGGQCLSLIHI